VARVRYEGYPCGGDQVKKKVTVRIEKIEIARAMRGATEKIELYMLTKKNAI